MSLYWRTIRAAVAGILGVTAAAVLIPSGTAGAQTAACTQNVLTGMQPARCWRGPVVIQSQTDPRTYRATFALVDGHGALQFWQGLTGAYEGDAPFCSTTVYTITPAACIGGYWDHLGNSQPIVVLYQGGRAYVITPHVAEVAIEIAGSRYDCRLLRIAQC